MGTKINGGFVIGSDFARLADLSVAQKKRFLIRRF